MVLTNNHKVMEEMKKLRETLIKDNTQLSGDLRRAERRIAELEQKLKQHHHSRQTIEEQSGWKYDGWLKETTEQLIT